MINKLENSGILLVFHVFKIQNIRFVGNLIPNRRCEFYYDDVTMTSLLNIKFGDVATERTVTNSVSLLFCLYLTKLNANQIYFEMHPVHGNKCSTKQTVHFWCKKMQGGQKFTSYIEEQSVVLQWQEQQPASFFCNRHSEAGSQRRQLFE